MAIYEIKQDTIEALPETSFSRVDIKERSDIQIHLLSRRILVMANRKL